MGVYEPTKRLGAAQGWSPLAQQLSAATLAGAAASLVRVPTEVVKTRMQTGQIGSGLQAVTTILRTEGLRKGLYAGYGSFLLRDLPFDAIEFVACAFVCLLFVAKINAGGREGRVPSKRCCGRRAWLTRARPARAARRRADEDRAAGCAGRVG